MKEALSEVGIYISEDLPPPQKKSIDTEIASISVSVVKLTVLPVLGTVSTSNLFNRSPIGEDMDKSMVVCFLLPVYVYCSMSQRKNGEKWLIFDEIMK